MINSIGVYFLINIHERGCCQCPWSTGIVTWDPYASDVKSNQSLVIMDLMTIECNEVLNSLKFPSLVFVLGTVIN